MSYRQLHRHCPSCRTELAEIGDDVGEAEPWYTCAECSGLWLTEGEFFRHFKNAQPRREVDELLVHNDGSPRRPCPMCAEPMDVAWLDFLQLDQCSGHGIWFDAGELDRALANDTGLKEVRELLEASKAARAKKRKRKLG